MIEGTLHFLTSWEVAAQLTTGRRCWCCDRFRRQSWGSSAHVSEETVWFSTFCIIFTIWMNKQTLLSKFTTGKGFARRHGVMVNALVPILAGRPVLAALQQLLWLLSHAQLTHLSVCKATICVLTLPAQPAGVLRAEETREAPARGCRVLGGSHSFRAHVLLLI